MTGAELQRNRIGCRILVRQAGAPALQFCVRPESSFIASLCEVHGFEVERLAMQFRRRDLAIALKFPCKHVGEIFIVA